VRFLGLPWAVPGFRCQIVAGTSHGGPSRHSAGGAAPVPWQTGQVPIRIYVLDDHELVRTGLQTLLECEDDLEVVGQAATAQQGLREIEALNPDVAILDVRLPDGSGIEVCRDIKSTNPDIACLMLTSYADDEALFSAIMAGAAGYVLKEIGGSDLIGDIRRVSQGASLIDATLSKDIFDRLRKSQRTEARLSSLSPQERKVLDLIAQGRSNRQIAEEIFLAEKTVKNYVSSLLSKLGMQRRTEAGVYAAILAERAKASPALEV
jgi:DNA-binding NarL/FixJ family response regulator